MGTYVTQYCCSLVFRLAGKRPWLLLPLDLQEKPYLEKGKVKVACHPSNNVPFIYPFAASDDRALWEEAGEQEDDDTLKVSEVYKQWKDAKTSPPVAVREDELDEEDVPRVRCRP